MVSGNYYYYILSESNDQSIYQLICFLFLLYLSLPKGVYQSVLGIKEVSLFEIEEYYICINNHHSSNILYSSIYLPIYCISSFLFRYRSLLEQYGFHITVSTLPHFWIFPPIIVTIATKPLNQQI